jgi:hypothetical protein
VTPSEWFPERHFIAWCYAIFEGPADYDIDGVKAYLRRTFDLCYGVINRFVLHMARPEDAIKRVSHLWKKEHTTGALEARLVKGGAVLRLTNSPYTRTPHTRAGLSENYRYALSLTRAKDVREWHALEDGALVVYLTWK